MRLLYESFEIMNLISKKNVPTGGAAVEWYNWLKGFKKIGCEVGILTWKGSNAEIKEKEFDYDLVESYDLNKGIPKLRLFYYRIPSYYKAIKSYNPDFLLEGCATENTGIMAFLSKVTGKPFIHRIGSDMDVDGRIARNFSKLSLAVYYYGLKNADHISCQNKYQYEILKRKYPNKSISILYNSIEIKKPFNKNVEKEYIAWVGNFRYEKNLPAVAEIVKKLSCYKFKIAGTRFSTTDEDAKRGLNELENLENVEFVGHLTNIEIRDFLSNAYCLLNTSRLEGFSNTFLEAWSVGIPVVTTINVNPDNIIKEHNLGIVAEDYESLPKIINELISSKGYLDFGERCFKYVSEKHNPEILATQFLNDMKSCKKVF